MGNLLYYIAVILVIVWAIGYLGYHVGESNTYTSSNCSYFSIASSD